MAATTAAVVAAAATVAGTATSVASQAGAFGGGSQSGGGSGYSRTPMDPHQRAMRDYYARMVVENQDKTYPSFGEFLSSGGDPEKAKFDLTVPGMKPSEAAALGLTGGRGEAIPYYDSTAGEGSMTPEQRLYLAKERRRRARETGEKMPTFTWAEASLNANERYNRLQKRLDEVSAIPEELRTRKQTRQAERIPDRLAGIKERNPHLGLGE